ncbi:MAG: membrane protein insertion efficiency factor YidD [Desulfuromonadales bacterium]|nr:membrane protein insertion efficiency factor YidD [Desulfuromonadales bacterium]
MAVKPLLFLIDIYRYLISPLFPQSCRFYPSCSNYAREALLTFGLIRGGFLTIKRLLRCHPFHPGGFDPLPHTEKQEI